MGFYGNLVKSLLEAIEIEKGNVPLVQRKNMPAPTFYVAESEAIKQGEQVNRAGIPFDEIWGELMKDEEFVREYERLRPRYELIEQIIIARKEQNLTQSDLAKLMGTQKSNISRFESGNYNPSLDFIIKIAQCLGKELKIQMI